MMKEEDESDKQKRAKYNSAHINDNSNNKITKNDPPVQPIKNKSEDSEEKKDWDYVKTKNKNNEQINLNKNEINNEIENEENIENDYEINEEFEEEDEEIIQKEENDNDNNINNIGEDIINKHMVIIKESANILSEEGDLITNIKGVGKKQNFALDNYIDGLELIVDKKLDMYQEIKNKIKKYRKAKISNGKNQE